MRTIIEAKMKEALDTVKGQSEALMNEINSVIDGLNNDKMIFNTAMQGIHKDRARAYKLMADCDDRQAEAMRAFDTGLMQAAGILVGLNNQIKGGEIVSNDGSEVYPTPPVPLGLPPARKTLPLSKAPRRPVDGKEGSGATPTPSRR